MNTNTLRTIYGKADYCWLSKADIKFNPKGTYHVDLIVKKEDAEAEIKAINEVISKNSEKLNTTTLVKLQHYTSQRILSFLRA